MVADHNKIKGIRLKRKETKKKRNLHKRFRPQPITPFSTKPTRMQDWNRWKRRIDVRRSEKISFTLDMMRMPDCWHFVGSMKALRRFFFQGASKFTNRIRKTVYTFTKKNENKYIQMLSSLFLGLFG